MTVNGYSLNDRRDHANPLAGVWEVERRKLDAALSDRRSPSRVVPAVIGVAVHHLNSEILRRAQWL